MKEIKATIQPFTLAHVIDALKELEGLPGITVSKVQDLGKRWPPTRRAVSPKAARPGGGHTEVEALARATALRAPSDHPMALTFLGYASPWVAIAADMGGVATDDVQRAAAALNDPPAIEKGPTPDNGLLRAPRVIAHRAQ